MNRILYQLSYAAIFRQRRLPPPKISFVIISVHGIFVKRKFVFLPEFFGKIECEVTFLEIWKQIMLFSCGGGGYVTLELLWRGRSHGSMFFAGGCCLLLLGRLSRSRLSLSALWRGVVGGELITGVELLFGLLVNRNYTVWDYRNMPLQYRGQICLPYTLLWMPLSLGGMALYRVLRQSIDKRLP